MTKQPLSQCHGSHSRGKVLNMNEEALVNGVTVSERAHVTEEVDFCKLETLVTRIQSSYETPSPVESDVCDFSDIKYEELEREKRKAKLQRMFEWFDVVLSEGHIEPGQPSVGRQVGWPVRAFNIRSLWVDYYLWNSKKGVDVDELYEKRVFRCLVFLIFDRQYDVYVVFPLLEISRKKYKALRGIFEYFEID